MTADFIAIQKDGLTMIEGWHGEDYLILFDETEATELSRRYDIGKYLAGYKIVGLQGWDDFIVATTNSELFTIPTVPIDSKYSAPLGFAIEPSQLQSDERFRGRIKWYIKPIAFGGDPASDSNMTWVNLEQHVELVKWWNELYQTVKAPSEEGK